MKKVIAVSAALLLAAASLCAQSAERISSIITSREITYGQAAYLTASYRYESEGKAEAEPLSEEAAFTEMVTGGYISQKHQAGDTIPLNELSLLYMRVTNLSGGLFYSLFHTPRYAYRELKAQGLIPEKSDPSQKVAGRDSIALLSGCIELTGGAK